MEIIPSTRLSKSLMRVLSILAKLIAMFSRYLEALKVSNSYSGPSVNGFGFDTSRKKVNVFCGKERDL